jgi:diguanylate cyclase (GGDEF)-like protein
MASTAFTWENVGPRADERVLAGEVAGLLWLTVAPMVWISLALPGRHGGHPLLLALMVLPSIAWSLACLFLIDWQRVRSPLVYHVPAASALPYIAVLVASSGGERSPFGLMLLMLIAYCSYFFTPRGAIPYLIGCVLVQAFPLLYAPDAFDSELPTTVMVSVFVYSAVGGVIIVGKTQLLSLRDAARELSLRDSLTGLANRRAMGELLDSHRAAAGAGPSRRDDSLGLLLIDLDDFKEVNTLHGLPGGDRVLCATADALRGLSRSGDTVIRLGGDEFAIVGAGFTRGGMERLARRALERVREICAELELEGLEITASAGWALFPGDADSIDQLVMVADLSLRAAKAEGKNRWHLPVRPLEQLHS